MKNTYEYQVAMAEAYSSAYCDARPDLTKFDIETSVWSAVRAGYLQALSDRSITLSDEQAAEENDCYTLESRRGFLLGIEHERNKGSGK